MPKPIINPHDKLFRTAMANKKLASEFFQNFLPKSIVNSLDSNSIELLQQSYIDEDLSESISDLVFQCDFADKRGYLAILVEHQSKPDKWLALRAHRYLLNFLYRQQQEKQIDKLQPVYMLVFYHGEQTPYPYSLNIKDCFEDPENLMSEVLYQSVPLVDVNTLSDEELVKQQWVGPLALSMKYIRSKRFDEKLDYILTNIGWPLDEPAEVALLQQMLLYLFTSGNIKNAQTYLESCYDKVSLSMRSQLMSIAEQLEAVGFEKGIEQGIEKGIEQGVEKGKSELLRQLLTKRFGSLSPDVDAKLGKASRDQLEQWAERIFEVQTLEQLFDESNFN